MADGTVRRRARARAAAVVRAVRDRDPGAAAAPVPPGMGDDRSRALVPDEALWAIAERYRGSFAPQPLSYGTVRDLADSSEALPRLATASFDMKNLQRCWALKAVVGNVEPGARVVEVGAGEPLVAGTLSRVGYRVAVVDPYDGSGNGPIEYRSFKHAYPGLTFVREAFPPAESLAEPVACVYSISVLEHTSADDGARAIEAARELVGDGGLSIHAIDHVLRGWGAEEHLERLKRIASASGFSGEQVDAILERMDADPDSYLVSAEAHDTWRGQLPYDEYPMRRIGSVQIFDRVGS
jgi:hypothetical protein